MSYFVLFLLGFFISIYFYFKNKENKNELNEECIHCDDTSEVENINTNNRNVVIVVSNNSTIKNINIR